VISAANAYGTGSAILEISVTYAALPALAIVNVTNTYSSPYCWTLPSPCGMTPTRAPIPRRQPSRARPNKFRRCAWKGPNLLTASDWDETAFIVNRVAGANGRS